MTFGSGRPNRGPTRDESGAINSVHLLLLPTKKLESPRPRCRLITILPEAIQRNASGRFICAVVKREPVLKVWEHRFERGVDRLDAAACPRVSTEVNMRNLILATASVLALGLSAGASHADIGWECGYGFPCKPSLAQIQQAQQMLRAQGLYNGSIVEVGSIPLDAKTKQAVKQYQEQNGLDPTGTLDERTMASLLENTGIAGSSTPSNSNRMTTNAHPASVPTGPLHGGAPI
jgi:hypothetical protein